MLRGIRFVTAACAWALLVPTLLAGCEGPVGLDAAGVTLTLPDGWTAVAPETWPVTGRPLAAWSGPGGASLVIHTNLPVPDPDAGALAFELVNRLANNPGMEGLGHRVEMVAGREAGRVDLVAPGTGSALAPVGLGRPVSPDGADLVPTRRVAVLFPRAADTLILTWHLPEADSGARMPEIEAALAGLSIRDEAPAISSY